MVELSIRRPTFIVCIVIVMLATGLFAMGRLGVDLFPNVTFPVVTVTTAYPGSGPGEVETLVTKPLEDQLSTLSGIKRLSSISQEGVSTVIAEFTLETDVKFAEQQVRDRAMAAHVKFPVDAKESVIRRIDPGDQPVLQLALDADLPPQDLYDLANEVIRPRLEQIHQVGLVEVIGGRKREILVELDRNKLKSHELSASQVAQRLSIAGENIPIGKVSEGQKEIVFRSLGQFKTIDDIKKTVVNFFGSDVSVTLDQVASIKDGLRDESSRAVLNGKRSLSIFIFKQSGSNTIQVVDRLQKRVSEINADLSRAAGSPKLILVRDGSLWIRANVLDVKESIFFGVLLAVIVVFYFLGNGRSTIITGLALPNSLIGAFILMWMAGFSINVMTLLALSLSVGLLVDDAIVVRENIFRHMEMGKNSFWAARIGTKEVQLAVIATTFTILGVFGPVGFLKGVTGQFFREFGLTICFAMLISLFDALTIAPMLSAYFAGATHENKDDKSKNRALGFGLAVLGFVIWFSLWFIAGEASIWILLLACLMAALAAFIPALFAPLRSILVEEILAASVRGFDRFQNSLEDRYERFLYFVLRRPILVLSGSLLVALVSCSTVALVPKTFLPSQDAGEFSATIDLTPGTSLDETAKMAESVDKVIRANPEVRVSAYTVGNRDGQANYAEFYVQLVERRSRSVNTSQFKEKLREQLKPFSGANPVVKDYDAIGGGFRPFALNLVSDDSVALEKYALALKERLHRYPGLLDVDTNFRSGKPEFQVAVYNKQADRLGVSAVQIGNDLRAQIEGVTPAKFREKGREYDVRVRLREDQRNLREGFDQTYVPNINLNLVRLQDVARGIEAAGPTKITRQNRSRYVQINADIAPGAGLGNIMTDVSKIMETELKLPPGMTYAYIGQAENFKEMSESMITAMGFGILFIFLILASLYESFVTPFTIMVALPLALSGSFVFLFIFRESLNIFSMIGSIMLLGVATKNSILLVDYANQLVLQGKERGAAIVEAGRVRLRPILMTTAALIAGSIPIAIGFNEASKQRTSMGVAIIGGLVSSTLLTLIVVPAIYPFFDRYRHWSRGILARVFGAQSKAQDAN